MLNLIRKRRSCRKFTSQNVEKEKIEKLIKAALWSPTSKNNRPWEFVIVTEKEKVEKLSQCKPHGASFLSQAPLAIVILADEEKSDVWIEDCSIAAILLQMTAEELNLGSTWIQIRKRMHNETTTAEEFVKNQLNVPSHLKVASILAIGYKEKEREPYSEDILLKERIHYNNF
ncbi:nitroreductase family protein [Marinilabiliaceae bacterium ANBcel2]|nr:nitroreductase family protein [Marinilabiliaceae bacterium ANBcel2]